jgi:hypothetical protein
MLRNGVVQRRRVRWGRISIAWALHYEGVREVCRGRGGVVDVQRSRTKRSHIWTAHSGSSVIAILEHIFLSLSPPPTLLNANATTATMLDTFEIITTSGVVLWSKTYVPISPSLINNLIREVFIEERGANARADNSGGQKPTYRRDGYTLKWTAAKDLGLVFVVRCDSSLCGYCARSINTHS